jgi:hypothetical protein
MISIQIPKKTQINRMMKGCGMRIVEGDYQININPELIRKIKNKFNKGKSHTLYSADIVGEGLSQMYNKAKKSVQSEIKLTARQLKKEAIQSARELKKDAIQSAKEFKKQAIDAAIDSGKPYLKELVQAGILGLGGAAAVAQPELAPFIGAVTLGAEAYANSFIDNIGAPRQTPRPILDDKEDNADYGDQYLSQTESQPNHELFHSVIHDTTSSQQGLIGYGLRAKRGAGLFAGGGLVTQNKTLHNSLQSSNPIFHLNRNILPAYLQNQMYY